MTPLHYRIAPLDVHAHLLEVACTVRDPDPAGQHFRLPAWTPGSYLIREFARHVVRVAARTAQAPVAIEKVGKDRWRAAACDGPLEVVIQVYAFDLSVRTAYLDAGRAFFNGASVFLLPEGHAHETCTLDIDASFGASIAGGARGDIHAPSAERPPGASAPTVPKTTTSSSTIRWRSAASPLRLSTPAACRTKSPSPVHVTST